MKQYVKWIMRAAVIILVGCLLTATILQCSHLKTATKTVNHQQKVIDSLLLHKALMTVSLNVTDKSTIKLNQKKNSGIIYVADERTYRLEVDSNSFVTILGK